MSALSSSLLRASEYSFHSVDSLSRLGGLSPFFIALLRTAGSDIAALPICALLACLPPVTLCPNNTPVSSTISLERLISPMTSSICFLVLAPVTAPLRTAFPGLNPINSSSSVRSGLLGTLGPVSVSVACCWFSIPCLYSSLTSSGFGIDVDTVMLWSLPTLSALITLTNELSLSSIIPKRSGAVFAFGISCLVFNVPTAFLAAGPTPGITPGITPNASKAALPNSPLPKRLPVRLAAGSIPNGVKSNRPLLPLSSNRVSSVPNKLPDCLLAV